MCVTKLTASSGCGFINPSPVRGNTAQARSRYRVLRAARSRGLPRSVDRDCAGRNALSVKGLSPDNQYISVVAEQVWSSEGNTTAQGSCGATGVLDHGMYRQRLSERERSARGLAHRTEPGPRDGVQGIKTKYAAIPLAEVRCFRSSEEVG
jgi:hypothetical protein